MDKKLIKLLFILPITTHRIHLAENKGYAFDFIMNRLLLTFLFFSLLGTTTYSQQRSCGVWNPAHQDRISPEHKDLHFQKRQVFKKRMRRTSKNRSACASPAQLPIAIHFQDIANPDTVCLRALAEDQVNILNQDLMGTNSDIALWNVDATSYPGINHGQTCIEFIIANNNHPTGYGLSDGGLAVTINTTSGDYLPDWTGYVNIVVRDIVDLGYAPLGGMGNGDAITVDDNAFGTTGCGQVIPQVPYHHGRTLVHELGHYLYLNHIWANSSDVGGCENDDGIADTPIVDGPHYGCPDMSASCSSNDLHMNFMDYVNDACMYMFTKGQKERILSVLNTSRKSLFDSKGCQNLSFDVDGSISVKSIDENYCGNSYPLEVNISNVGQNLIETLHIEYRVNDGTNFSFNKNVNLKPGEVETLSLANISITGENIFDVVIALVNGIQDQNIENNNIRFSVITTEFAPIPLAESFERGAERLKQNGWRNDNIDQDDFEWVVEDQVGAPPTSIGSLMFDNFNGDSLNNPRNKLDHFITPSFDLTNASAVSFSFDRAYARYDEIFYDGLSLYYSKDCGNSWDQFWFKENTDLATFPFNVDGNVRFFPSTADWETETIELNQLAGEREVLFRITNISGWGQFLWIDNININAELTSVPIHIIEEGIALYPNPTKDGLAIIDILQEKQLYEQISVYNMFGQIVLQQAIHPSNQSILLDLTNQPSGIYIVDALSKTGYHTVQRLVISKQ